MLRSNMKRLNRNITLFTSLQIKNELMKIVDEY